MANVASGIRESDEQPVRVEVFDQNSLGRLAQTQST